MAELHIECQVCDRGLYAQPGQIANCVCGATYHVVLDIAPADEATESRIAGRFGDAAGAELQEETSAPSE